MAPILFVCHSCAYYYRGFPGIFKPSRQLHGTRNGTRHMEKPRLFHRGSIRYRQADIGYAATWRRPISFVSGTSSSSNRRIMRSRRASSWGSS